MIRDRELASILGVAALLRLLRAAVRVDEVAFLYAAYPTQTTQAVEAGDWGRALSTWTGLHPPLWSLLHAMSERWAPIPALWIGGSALCSWLAVWALARVDRTAGWLLATGPIALSYCAEVNDYPLVLLWTGLAAALLRRDQPGRGWWMGLVGALAAWTHPLAGLVVGLCALALPGVERLRALGLLVGGALPLLPGAWALATDPGSARQPPFKAGLVAIDFFTRHGPFALLALPFAAQAARSHRGLALISGAGALVIGLLTAIGIAAPHQFPYWTALSASFALLVAAGAPRRIALALALAQGLFIGGRDLLLLRQIAQDPLQEAFSAVWSELSEPYTCVGDPRPACAGDALYLLAPGGLNDDDKRRGSAIMWAMGPFSAMPRVQPYAFDPADYHHGQPRLVAGFVVYVNDQVHPQLAEAAAAHPRLWVLVYEAAGRRAFADQVAQILNRTPRAVGPALLYAAGTR